MVLFLRELVATTRRSDNRLAQWVLENPWKVGRHRIAREYASGNLDALIERIETASLHWAAALSHAHEDYFFFLPLSAAPDPAKLPDFGGFAACRRKLTRCQPCQLAVAIWPRCIARSGAAHRAGAHNPHLCPLAILQSSPRRLEPGSRVSRIKGHPA